MAMRISRRKLAAYYADQLLAGNSHATTTVAAYLVDTKRTGEAPLLVRDVEYALLNRGVAVVDIASARKLDDSIRQELQRFIAAATNATTVQSRIVTEPDLLGGVRFTLPGKEFDGTFRRKLTTLKARKV